MGQDSLPDSRLLQDTLPHDRLEIRWINRSGPRGCSQIHYFMPDYIRFFTACLLLIASACRPDQPAVHVYEEEGAAIIEQEQLRIAFDLSTGKYDINHRSDGKALIRGATFQINDLQPDSTWQYEWAALPLQDSLGSGQTLSIKATKSGQPGLILQLQLYENAHYVAFNWGYQNTSPRPVQVKNAAVLSGVAYPGAAFRDYYVLDGESNDYQTVVTQADTLLSTNNLLATWGAKGQTKTAVVAGGLTYLEFLKYMEAIKVEDGLQLRMWLEDPVGKRVDPDSTFLSTDRFYLDLLTSNRYEALEQYGQVLAKANKVDISGPDYAILNFWYAYIRYYGGDEFLNNTAGTVEAMEKTAQTGFLKYGPIGIRLEPDDYAMPNNQQGWWDDEHWAMYEGGQFLPPYETLNKWAEAIHNLGGRPFLYFQTARRSEDYALAHPEHMLFNDAHRERSGGPEGWWEGGDRYWSYDFTDPGFVAHMEDVYARLRKAGVAGVKYDYPLTGWAYDGGFEAPYATTAYAYRRIYELAYDGLGPGRDIHERMGKGDITLGVITTHRTEGDNDVVMPPMTAKTGLRWYKNRVVYHCDQDARNPYNALPYSSRHGVRAMFTMTYLTSGRMEIGKYLYKMADTMQYDLSRVLPLHQTPVSPRPVDAFSGVDYPQVYDLPLTDQWHILTFYNTRWTGQEWPSTLKGRYKKLEEKLLPQTIGLPLGAPTDEGGLGFAAGQLFHVWDFWNTRYLGTYSGSDSLIQHLAPGEARVMAIHAATPHPQFLSTNRHILQGYVEMPGLPVWDAQQKQLQGSVETIGEEEMQLFFSANGSTVRTVKSDAAAVRWGWIDEEKGIFALYLTTTANQLCAFTIDFE